MSRLPEEIASIGTYASVRIDVAAHDAVTVDSMLAIAGMFEREVEEKRPTGGLDHLDRALGSAITRLRADGIFSGSLGAMLTLSTPAPPVRAGSILVMGLGDPDLWRPDTMRGVVASAVREARRLDSVSAAFAPGLLDSGLPPDRLSGVSDAMLLGVLDALATVGGGALTHWIFCTGPTHFDDNAAAFRQGLARLVRCPLR